MSLGKPTELTLKDLLHAELEPRSVDVSSQVSFRSVDGEGVWFLVWFCVMVLSMLYR